MDIALRLLIIEDNPEDSLHIMRALRRKFPRLLLEPIADTRSFARALERGDFDLVITDYQLGWTNGLAVVQEVKARYPHCPVVMLTAADSEEIAVSAMKAGLDDYVLKTSPPLAHLAAAVKAAVERVEQSKALKEAETRYRDLFEGVPVGLYRSTPQGKILEANPALVQIFGYPDRESLLATNAVELYLSPQDRQRWLSRLEAKRLVQDFEMPTRRRDGTVIWVRNSARAVCDAAGKMLYLEGSILDITEHKRVEELFRSTTVISVSAMCIHQDGKFQFINPRFQDFIGYGEEEVLGTDALHFVHPEDRKEVREKAIKMLKGEEGTPYAYRVVVRGGEIRWVLETVAPIISRGRRAVLGSFMDITERKRTEELFRSMTTSSLTGICIHQDGKFQFINPKFKEFIGYGEEVLGTDALQFIHPEDRREVRDKAIKMLKGERKTPYEYRVVVKGGEIRWVLETVASLEYKGRRAVLGNFMDITEHKRTEELFRRMTTSSLSGVCIVQDSRFQFVNPKLMCYLGCTEEELLGNDIFQFIHPEDRGKVRENAIRMLKGEKETPYGYRVVTKTGEVRWILETVAPIECEGRRAVLASFMDITEWRRA